MQTLDFYHNGVPCIKCCDCNNDALKGLWPRSTVGALLFKHGGTAFHFDCNLGILQIVWIFATMECLACSDVNATSM